MQLAEVRLADFSALATRDDAQILVKLAGTADASATDIVDELFTKVHAERANLEEVIVDLRELEFMNSSCLKGVLTWVNGIQDLDREEWYRIRFLSNPKYHWQRRSLHVVQCFATELITVTQS